MPSTGRKGEYDKASVWTLEQLKEHYAEIDQWRLRFFDERDRRYREVDLERERALQIKNTADRDALELAREIQTYKDEKANELREQINRERGLYATKEDLGNALGKMELALKPLTEYVSVMRGRSSGLNAGWGWIVGAVAFVSSVVVIANAVFSK